MWALLAEDVAGAADGVDHPGLAASLELLAQVADVHLEHVGLGLEVEAPDPLEEVLAAEHLSRLAEEGRQQLILLRRQLDPAVPAPDVARAGVDLEVGVAKHLSGYLGL